jgi:TatD DNase family protein
MASAYSGVMPAFGVHPQWTTCWNVQAEAALHHLANKAVAIGEIGLDYSANSPERQLQQRVFRAQIRIAREARLPILIHCRNAFADLLAIVKEEGVADVGGIMHGFSGSLEVAKECTQLGLLIGVAGPVTYANAKRLPQVVAALGLQYLVLETDAPDLTPEPLRGEHNVPANLLIIARKVAELCESTLDTVANITTANIRRVVSLPTLRSALPEV